MSVWKIRYSSDDVRHYRMNEFPKETIRARLSSQSGIQRECEEGLPYDRKLNLELNAKYHLTLDLTTDITWNTDFFYIEVQINNL